MKTLLVAILMSSLLLVGFVGSSQATAINNGFGLASPAQTLTFDEVVLPVDTLVTNQYAGYGVTFNPAIYYSPETNFAGISGNDLGNFNSLVTTSVNPVEIWFANPLTDAAFAMAADNTPYTFAAFLNGVQVDSATYTVGATDTAHDFFGFQGGPLFNEIRITQSATGGGPYWLIDNLQTGQLSSPVPEPCTMLLLGFGLLGLAGLRRKFGA